MTEHESLNKENIRMLIRHLDARDVDLEYYPNREKITGIIVKTGKKNILLEMDKVETQLEHEPMHKKHEFSETPAYIKINGAERTKVYLCIHNNKASQHCWETKEVTE